MRKVLYTAMTGGHDDILQPSIIADGFDYILFTNDIPEQQLGIWRVRHIPYDNKDPRRVARWVKTHPHILLPDYDYSLWHDSNVVVDSQAYFERIDDLIKTNVLIASMDHNVRSCIYEEGFAVLNYRFDSIDNVLGEMYYLKKEGYPTNNGLIETNCLLRKHTDVNVANMCDDWWRMIEKYSKRDQLSFNYVVWKNDLKIKLILPERMNARNHSYIHCISHKNGTPEEVKAVWYIVSTMFVEKSLPLYKEFVESRSKGLTLWLLKERVRIICIYYIYLLTWKYFVGTKVKMGIKRFVK